jgi:uncharacterized membrane protein
VAVCCLIHAGIAGALLGWSIGSWTGVLVAAALALLLVGVMQRKARGRVTDDRRERSSIVAGPTR